MPETGTEHPGEARWVQAHERTSNGSNGREHQMKTVMGWIDKIVSALARRKVDKDERRR